MEQPMSEDTFYEDDDINDLQERFKARREEIYRRIEQGIPPEPMQFVTPRRVHKSDKLRAMVESLTKAATVIQVGETIDRPPGTGSIGELAEEARRQFPHLDKD
jgi:hypothetical protein